MFPVDIAAPPPDAPGWAEGPSAGRATAAGDGGADLVARFVDRYCADFAAGDVEAVVAAYRLPCPIVRPDATAMIVSRRGLRHELGRTVEFYRWAGMTRVDAEGLRFEGRFAGLWIAHATWVPRDARGREINRVDASYAVRLRRGEPRFVALFSHNERERRQPVVEALGGPSGAPPAPRPVAGPRRRATDVLGRDR
jgi:hypothetical protein